MVLNKASEMLAAAWLSQTQVKNNYHNFSRGNTVFLSGGKPKEAVQFI